MGSRNETMKQVRQKMMIRMVVMCLTGILVNMAGSMVAKALNLPMYLDSIGTIGTAVLGGYFPGVIVGFGSNLINSVQDPANAYYASISVLLALAAAFFSGKGYYRVWWKALLTVFPFALIGGGLGSILTYLIYNMGIGDVVSSGFTKILMDSGGLPVFPAQLISDIVVDLGDKAITVILVFLVSKALLRRFKDYIRIDGWRQRPISEEDRRKIDKERFTAMSLRSKILAMIGFMTIFIAAVTAGISFFLYHRETVDSNKQFGTGLSRLVAAVIPGDQVETYLTEGKKAEGYLQIEEELERIRLTSDDIMYVYVYQIRDDGCYVVFDLDTEDTPAGQPGEFVDFDEAFMPYLDELLAGKPIEPIISNEKFGWLMTTYEPIYDSAGKCRAYACVDISMNRVTLQEISFLTRVVSLFFGFFLMILAIGLWISNYNLIYPINTMALAANEFVYQSEKERLGSVERFRNLEISTDDEIEKLYHSFLSTIEETMQYIEDIREKSEALSKMQNGLITVLADMVESRDKCTGDHVRKTAAYCRIILEQLYRNGDFRDEITPEFIEDVVNSAPLHDVGKIKISDMILNKPGRLTDEEFEEMKKHTVAGNDIITEAMRLVSTDAGYLKEAKNLSAYHHEKWNGTGYPTGIKGTEIPLSARVMAVADVFDALVSERSYKKPFTVEKALDIIREGSGTHFDPTVVNAFLQVQGQAEEIAHSFVHQYENTELPELKTGVIPVVKIDSIRESENKS